MCQSSVWLRYPDGRTKKIAEDVLVVAQEGDVVVLRWFLAETRCIVGTIQEVDVVKHVITLSVPESPSDRTEQPDAAATFPDSGAVHRHTHPHR